MFAFVILHICLILVMQPISSTAKLLMNKEETTTLPKMLADVVMDDIAVLISRQQVNCL